MVLKYRTSVFSLLDRCGISDLSKMYIELICWLANLAISYDVV